MLRSAFHRAALAACAVGVLVSFVVPSAAGAQANLTVERIFSGEFRGSGVGPSRWLDDSTYTVVEPSASGGGADLVKVDAASGRKSVLIASSRLVPRSGREPLDIEDYDWS